MIQSKPSYKGAVSRIKYQCKICKEIFFGTRRRTKCIDKNCGGDINKIGERRKTVKKEHTITKKLYQVPNLSYDDIGDNIDKLLAGEL